MNCGGQTLWKLAVLQRIQIGADAQLGPRNRGDPVVIRPSRARQHYASDNQGDNRSVGKFRYKLLESSRPKSSSETIRPAFLDGYCSIRVETSEEGHHMTVVQGEGLPYKIWWHGMDRSALGRVK